MEIVHVYTKKRSEFGRQCTFSERPAKLEIDIVPDPSLIDNFIERNPCDQGLQAAPEQSEHAVSDGREEYQYGVRACVRVCVCLCVRARACVCVCVCLSFIFYVSHQ